MTTSVENQIAINFQLRMVGIPSSDRTPTGHLGQGIGEVTMAAGALMTMPAGGLRGSSHPDEFA